MKKLNPILTFFCIASAVVFLNQCEKVTYTYDDEKPGIVAQPIVLQVTDSTATIEWATDEACHVKIKYGPTTAYGQVCEDPENREIHQLTLTGLEPYMQYHYRIYNWDFADNGPVKSADTTFTTLPNAYSYLRDGWSAYVAGDLGLARQLFNESLSRNALFADVFAAFGWLQLRLDSLAAAQASFNAALAVESQAPIALAGLAVLSMVEDQPSNTIAHTTAILSVNPQWTYKYNPKINAQRLRLMLAEAYFLTGQIPQAQAQLDLLWPDNKLDPNVSATWKVKKQSYTSYESAFLAALNYLSQQIGPVW